MKLYTKYILMLLLCFLIAACSDDSNPVNNDINNISKLKINEICPNNATIIQDEDGNAGDWFEIYNDDVNDANMKGAYIKYTYVENEVSVKFEYQIPDDFIIPAKGFEIIWCDNKNKGIHTNFELQTILGGEIYILNENKGIVDSYNYSETPWSNGGKDQSIGFWEKQPGYEIWKLFGPGEPSMPTPRQANTVYIPVPDSTAS